MLLAIAMLMAAPAFFTSCQEDAPQINYTMSVSVTNDFSKVVEAINNGSLKNEEAINRLTAAIDKMNTDQQTKLQAIIDVLNSVNATLDTKLAAIEAAMKAQTLSLEGKLDLLEAAIKAMPDYSDNFDAVVAALNAMKTEIEELGNGQTAIAEKIATVTTAINNLIAEVNSGNTSAAAALAQIIQKLEELKGNIGGGGGETPGGDPPGGAVPPSTTLDGITFENIKKLETQMFTNLHLKLKEMTTVKKFLVYKTTEGHYGKMEVHKLGADKNGYLYIVISAVTYDNDGSILAQRSNVNLWGRDGFDFDTMYGSDDDSKIDFYFNIPNVSSTDYYMGKKGAKGAFYPQE